MRAFRFAGIVRKYFRPYTFIRPGEGGAYVDGKWVPAEPLREQRQGSIQPISTRLRAMEGGDYADTDRMLFTASEHANGDRIGYAGKQYTVTQETERGYSDINQYVISEVAANAPI